MSKRMMVLTPALVLAIAALVVYGATQTYAQDEPSYPTIIERLAERFGLNEDEVSGVFEEVREEKMAEANARFVERLDQMIESGELTEVQKQAILTKHEEMQQEHWQEKAQWQNMTDEERRAAIKARHEELGAWAQENGIDLELFFGGRGSGHHHFGMM